MAGSLTLLSSPAFAADRDCPDFDTQAEAQAYFESRGAGDPDRLDSDDDGEACESQFAGSDDDQGDDNGNSNEGDEDEGGTSTTPSGGVAAGAGGMADPSVALPATGALLGTALLGAGFATYRRRATAN